VKMPEVRIRILIEPRARMLAGRLSMLRDAAERSVDSPAPGDQGWCHGPTCWNVLHIQTLRDRREPEHASMRVASADRGGIDETAGRRMPHLARFNGRTARIKFYNSSK
jgi:hypothetical protein